jgi:hypothetical protein
LEDLNTRRTIIMLSRFLFPFIVSGVLILADTLQLLAFQPAQARDRLASSWQGILDAGGTKLTIVFKIVKGIDGTLTATLDSPDQGASGIPVSSAVIRGDSIIMDVKAVMGSYEGLIVAGDSTIVGIWKQSGMSFPLTLKRSSTPPQVLRPQLPRRPYPYSDEEVRYVNTQAGSVLTGTLTIPRGSGLFKAVLLISGSGAQDRDESLFGHKPFLVIADYLTRRGIAVLRVDDRGVGGSTGNTMLSTIDDLAGDVQAGIRFLKSRKEIDPRSIGLIGHSEGGMIAPLVASQSDDVAFIVMMAGTGLPGGQILQLQTALIMKAAGTPDELVGKVDTLYARICDAIRVEQDSAALAGELRLVFQSFQKGLTESERQQLGMTGAMADEQVRTLTMPWFRHFIVYDPRPALQKVTCPVLVINGERDLQVPPRQNLPEIEKALHTAGNSHVTVKEMPGLNHMFQKASTGSPSEYGTIEETISPDVLALIDDWIEQVGR